MAVKPIPEGYHTVTPYIIVEDAAKLIDFITAAFGAKEHYRMTGDGGKVMHAELQIGSSRVMIGGASERAKAMPAMFYLYVDDVDSAYKKAIDAGGTSVAELSNQFYGDRHGGVKDKWGNQWWVATHIEDVSPEEMKKREDEWRKKQAAGK